MNPKYGRTADLPDQRDIQFNKLAKANAVPATPSNYRLPINTPVYDQEDIGSCVANASVGAYRNLRYFSKESDFDGSRLGVYYYARAIDGNQEFDVGTSCRSGVKAIANVGIIPEILWPYVTHSFDVKPPVEDLPIAKNHRVLQYQSVDNTDWESVTAALYHHGNLIIGLTVYESFESSTVAKSGKVPIPKKTEKVLGGHCIRAIGYTPFNLICVNSWGTSWGDKGLCYLPKGYITNPNLASDFWTLVKA